jgi:hypothetical protein
MRSEPRTRFECHAIYQSNGQLSLRPSCAVKGVSAWHAASKLTLLATCVHFGFTMPWVFAKAVHSACVRVSLDLDKEVTYRGGLWRLLQWRLLHSQVYDFIPAIERATRQGQSCAGLILQKDLKRLPGDTKALGINAIRLNIITKLTQQLLPFEHTGRHRYRLGAASVVGFSRVSYPARSIDGRLRQIGTDCAGI